jgi:hypothetical protein
MRRERQSLSKRSELAERREKAWALVKRGKTLQEIADELGYSKSSAGRDVQHVLAEVTERTVQDAMRQRVVDVARVEDVIATWYPVAARVVFVPPEEEDAARLVPPATATGASEGEPTPEIRPVQALLDRDAAEVFLKAVDQKGKLLGYYRQEVAVYAQTPLVVASTDLSGLGEAELDAVIRNLQAALGAGDD